TKKEDEYQKKREIYAALVQQQGTGDPKVLAFRYHMLMDQLMNVWREKQGLEREIRTIRTTLPILRVDPGKSQTSQTPEGHAAWSLLFLAFGLNEDTYFGVPEIEIQDALKKHPKVVAAQRAIDKADEALREMRKNASPGSPLLVRPQKDLTE